ncbi:MAG: Co2+/Mg2+ efflux protein ApaG [Aurantimonas endophytica]|uniref:Protein ApaG n=1 Tax=Aurantimonas endophytica TaxID=1522175 RepID=A0A7W6HF04_9HYPH|nr:Co2+/Mg2+ efflux protein ApaG [Aurantimonas endophytica]MBB4003999.1 ApaG protein [Aurantimonas endophytica]MCO6404848.1 Co2+/Mg2+ efflux protein ApaG [Aurantimonas endophytica]
MYTATTRAITVSVTPSYLDDQSAPEDGRWVWAYTVEIANGSPDVVQLQSRYWHITDANGHVEEISGPGVVGEQPTLSPGDSFTYTSGCPLTTPSGFMRGHYRMRAPDGSLFEVEIPAFSLDLPARSRVLN